MLYKITVETILPPSAIQRIGCVLDSHTESRSTMLHCEFQDQSALFGALRKINDMGLVLISVNRA